MNFLCLIFLSQDIVLIIHWNIHVPFVFKLHKMSHLSYPFYHPIELNDTHHDNCFLKVRLFESNESSCPFIEYRNATTRDLCFEPVINGSTGWVFSQAESVFAGVTATLQATLGVVLNLLVIAVFLRTRSFRKEYLTPFILSLAATDLIYSSVTLPIIAVRDFTGYVYNKNVCLPCRKISIIIVNIRYTSFYFY